MLELGLPICVSYSRTWSTERLLQVVSMPEFCPLKSWISILLAGVTHASIEMWEYMDVIRRYANRRCSHHLENLSVTIDEMLSQNGTRKAVKSLFGLSDLSHDYDFVTTIEVSVQSSTEVQTTNHLSGRQTALGSWQDKNWDPAVGTTVFDQFCAQINQTYTSLEEAVKATGVDNGDVMQLFDCPGFDFSLLNYAAYVRKVGLFEV